MKSSRRAFIKKSSMAIGAITMLNNQSFAFGSSEKLIESIGFQSWTIREKLFQDFSGTMKMMADLGYHEIEMCSPLGYSNSGFKPLDKYTGLEMRGIINDSGLKCRSSHFTLGELRENLDNRIEWSQQMGLTQMMLASFWLPKTATVDDYRIAANELNTIGEKTKKEGLQMGFHNHHMEFEKRGEDLIYDAILEELDSNLVKLQFQVAVANIGYNASDYFRANPGRFISAHLSDWSVENNKQEVPIGQGIVDWKDFFEAAKIGGIKNVFVEMDPATFEASAQYLKNL